MNKTLSRGLIAGALLGTLSVGTVARADIGVSLNGQPLTTSAPPVQVNGRTLVPLRDIFEALGAKVEWNPVNQTISATQGVTLIQLGINNPNAIVNGRNIKLDQPAAILNGRTFVPLRFVAEATGAQVGWNTALQQVAITTAGAPVPVIPVTGTTPQPTGPLGGSQVGGMREISIPSGAVVPVQLDAALSSATTRVGTVFTASVVSRQLGDSEFPAGTKLEGIVVESRPSEKNQPGVLDFDFRAAILPDGTRVPLKGQLTSLDTNNVQQQDGRLVADGAKSSDKLKVVGIGAAGGYVLGRVLDTNSTLTTVLGAAGGYLFSRTRDKKAQEATLAQNTTLGVQLSNRVRYTDTTDYGRSRSTFLRNTSSSTAAAYNPRDYGFDERAAVRPSDRYDGYDVSDRMPVTQPVATNQNPVTYPNGTYNAGNPAPVYPPADTIVNTRTNDLYIPAGVVVPVTLDREISSATARVGDAFTATVTSQRLGDSEFPAGTKLEGRVIEAQPRQGDQPGVLNFDFRNAILPDGTRIPLTGELTSLDSKDVTTQDGRITAKANSNSTTDKLKVIGIGAAGGFVVGRVIKKDGILPSLLGALGGYLYSAKKGDKPNDAVVPANAPLGVKLNSRVSYTSADYYAPRAQYLRLN